MSMKPTLARKFDAVHKITVARRSMIPIVCRQTPRNRFWCGGHPLSEELRDFCDHEESIDLSFACEFSGREVGTGKTKLSAGTGARGPLIATTGFSKMNVACCCCASGFSSLAPLFHTNDYLIPGHAEGKKAAKVTSSSIICDPVSKGDPRANE